MLNNTLDVLNKICQKIDKQEVKTVTIDSFDVITYKVSQKQLDWLMSVYCKESKCFDTSCIITVKFDDISYTFGYPKYHNNVPYYIPNAKQYGKTFFIEKWSKITN